jgi:hypothetical protein
MPLAVQRNFGGAEVRLRPLSNVGYSYGDEAGRPKTQWDVARHLE